MLGIDDYKPLESKPANHPMTSDAWAERLSTIIFQVLDQCPVEIKKELEPHRYAIKVASNDVIKKALVSQRMAISTYLNNHGLHEAARCITGEQ